MRAIEIQLSTRIAQPFKSYGRRLLSGRPLWLVLLVCTVILYARRPDAFEHPQFWAEDGMFFQTERNWGLDALTAPYNGYHHAIPRLIALVAGRFDPAIVPLLYVGAALGLTLHVAGLALSDRLPFQRHIAFAMAVVAVPDAFEVLLNVANIQWVLGAGLVTLLLLRDPNTLGQKIHDLGASVLIGLTGPFSIVLLPLFVVRAWRRHTLFSWILAGSVCTTAAIQGASILGSNTPFPAEGEILYTHGAAAFGLRTGGSLFLGQWLPFPPMLVLGWILAILTVALALWLALRRGEQREARIMLLLAAGLILAGGLYRYRGAFQHLLGTLIGARYFFGAQLALLWLVLTLWVDARRSRRVMGVAAITVFLAVNLPRLREPALQDMNWTQYVEPLRRGEALVIATNPPGMTFVIDAKPNRPED